MTALRDDDEAWNASAAPRPVGSSTPLRNGALRGPAVPPLPRLREATDANDRRLDRRRERDGIARSRDEAGYTSPQSPDEDHPLALGLKIGLAMWVADLVARTLGFDAPTWSVLTAAFLATSPPIASAKAALRKLVALAAGLALGVAGAFAAKAMSGVPSIHFAIIGLATGWLGSRSPDYLFAAVVATVVTFVGSGGGDPTVEVATRTVCMVLIGCVIGPAVVFAVERARRKWHDGRLTA